MTEETGIAPRDPEIPVEPIIVPDGDTPPAEPEAGNEPETPTETTPEPEEPEPEPALPAG